MSLEEEPKKPVKEVLVVTDSGDFEHSTGDRYSGFFEAKKKDKSVKMHGPGVYTTAEGDTYSGSWEADRLGASQKVRVAYSDGSEYEGFFRDWCYAGPGKYTFPDGTAIHANFAESRPSGALKVVDPNGHVWPGVTDRGFCWVHPTNHYYDLLEDSRVIKKVESKFVVNPANVEK